MFAYRVALARSLLLIGLLVGLAVTWLAPLDAQATQQVDAGLKRALASFAAARALNAVLSVVQGTEVAVQPAGVGLTFAPGQVLDPINDLVEQFSTLMLAASLAFGVERVLIGVGGYWLVSALLSAAAVAWVWMRWREQAPPRMLVRALLVLLMLRFAVPVVVLGSEAGFQLFLADRYQAGQGSIELSTDQFARLKAPIAAPSAPSAEAGIGERLQSWWSNAAQSVDISQRVDGMKQAAEGMVEQLVMLMVVFLLQTLVLPLVLLWVLLQLSRALLLSAK